MIRTAISILGPHGEMMKQFIELDAAELVRAGLAEIQRQDHHDLVPQVMCEHMMQEQSTPTQHQAVPVESTHQKLMGQILKHIRAMGICLVDRPEKDTVGAICGLLSDLRSSKEAEKARADKYLAIIQTVYGYGSEDDRKITDAEAAEPNFVDQLLSWLMARGEYEAEKARAAKAEAERDTAVHELTSNLNEIEDRANKVEAERDAARNALRRIVLGIITFNDAREIAREALKGLDDTLGTTPQAVPVDPETARAIDGMKAWTDKETARADKAEDEVELLRTSVATTCADLNDVLGNESKLVSEVERLKAEIAEAVRLLRVCHHEFESEDPPSLFLNGTVRDFLAKHKDTP